MRVVLKQQGIPQSCEPKIKAWTWQEARSVNGRDMTLSPCQRRISGRVWCYFGHKEIWHLQKGMMNDPWCQKSNEKVKVHLTCKPQGSEVLGNMIIPTFFNIGSSSGVVEDSSCSQLQCLATTAAAISINGRILRGGFSCTLSSVYINKRIN